MNSLEEVRKALEPCGEGLLAIKCESRELHVCVGEYRAHAWCAGCGAKKPTPEGTRLSPPEDSFESSTPGSSSDYSGSSPSKADGRGAP